MPTHLLAWNPKRWDWKELPEVVAAFRSGKSLVKQWSCGTVKRIEVGDRAFLIRVGLEPKGIFGHGTVTKGSYEDVHWEDESKTCQYVKFQIDGIVDPTNDSIIPRVRLDEHPFASMHWDTQMSGVRIPEEIVDSLDSEWDTWTSVEQFSIPEQMEEADTYVEGTKSLITINSFERNPEARKACISHYGAVCIICDFDFSMTYGKLGEGFIHVHHLALIAARKSNYVLDPIEDLRPVCPNCHAMIHRRRKLLYSIDEVKKTLRAKVS
jgi:5-methylcytosine-specific restriction protein A